MINGVEREVIRSNLRHAREESEKWTERLANLRDDLKVRHDTSGDKFRITLDGQALDNRGDAGELLLRRPRRSFHNNRPKRNQAGKTNERRSMYEGKIHSFRATTACPP